MKSKSRFGSLVLALLAIVGFSLMPTNDPPPSVSLSGVSVLHDLPSLSSDVVFTADVVIFEQHSIPFVHSEPCDIYRKDTFCVSSINFESALQYWLSRSDLRHDLSSKTAASTHRKNYNLGLNRLIRIPESLNS